MSQKIDGFVNIHIYGNGYIRIACFGKGTVAPQDRVEIEQLMWEYIQALDSHDAEAFVSKFTPDGQFRSSESTEKGRDAMKKMVVDA
jgi:hypothetical protein